MINEEQNLDVIDDVVIDSIPAEPIHHKTYTKEQIDKTAQSAYAKGAEKARKEAAELYEQKIREIKAGMGQATQPVVNPDEIVDRFSQRMKDDARAYQEQLEDRRQKEELSKLADEYRHKMAKGKSLYPDFDEVLSDFNPAEFENVVYMAAKLDNTADILYDLNNRPEQMAIIETLYKQSPAKAEKKMKSLADSIKNNQDATKKTVSPREPLSRLKPSAIGSGGAMTIRDMKNDPYFRG